MSSEVRDPTSPSPLCLASHRHRGRARSDLARPRAHPGASPPPLPFWQRPDSRLDRAPYDSGAHGYESSRQATTTRSGTAARDARVTRARGARRAARRTHEDRTPRVSSRPRASIRGSRWSFASRSSPHGSVSSVVTPTNARAGTPCRRRRGPRRAPSTIPTRATRRATRRSPRPRPRPRDARAPFNPRPTPTPTTTVRWDDEVRRPRAFLVHVRRRTVDRSREEDDDDPATRAQLVFALTFP